MRSGLKRDYLTIERNVQTQGTSGETIDNWSVLGYTFAHMRAEVGDEEQIIYRISIRYRDITPNDRLIFGSKIFNILSVLDKSGMARELQLEARELI